MSTIESPTAAVSPEPIRTCIGCRKTAAKSQLLRVVCLDGVITADPLARLVGRGAYVHRDAACAEKAETRRAFQRAFRLSTPPVGVQELRMSMATTHHAGA